MYLFRLMKELRLGLLLGLGFSCCQAEKQKTDKHFGSSSHQHPSSVLSSLLSKYADPFGVQWEPQVLLNYGYFVLLWK